MRSEKRGERVFAAVLCVLALLAFLALNLLTRVMRDDWSYTFNFVTKERIDSFGAIFQSLGIHYTNVNGRLPVHFLAHLFLWMGKGAFNGINTLAFALLVMLIAVHGLGTLHSPYVPLAVWGLLWAVTPAYGESFLWVTGAANYLYGMLLILLFLLPWRRLLAREEAGAPPWAPMLAPLGLLAGWTNENTACALCALLLGTLLWRRFGEKKRINPWCWLSLAAAAAGLLLMVLAPGELSRLGGTGGTGGPGAILRRALIITYKLARYLWPVLLLWLALLLRFLRTPGRDMGKLAQPLLFLLAGLAAAYSMAVPPVMPDRIWSGPAIYLLISLLALWQAAGEPQPRQPKLRMAAAALCAAAVLLSLALSGRKVAATAAAFDAREEQAAAQLAEGRRDLVLPAVRGSGARADAAEAYDDITTDPADWLNVALARYLGAASVTAEGDGAHG